MWLWMICIGALIATACLSAYFYNRLVRGRLLVREAFSGMDVQLKRRHDLIPNLVSAVKGYASFEQQTLEEVTRLRAQAKDASAYDDREQAETKLASAIGRLFALAENYPDLKSDAQFLNLQQQLSEVEDVIQKARRYYNGTVRDYNISVQSFPSMIFAAMFAFHSEPFFQIDNQDERAVPHVTLAS